MCTGLELVLLAGTAVSAVAAIDSAETQSDIADNQAQQAKNEGAYREDAAKQQADKLRKAARAQRGETATALAKSGVKLGEGTPLELDKQIAVGGEQDAMSAILTGGRSAAASRQEANMLEASGAAASRAGYYQAGSTVLGAGSSYSRWKGGKQ
jgi:hypothetical protein